MSEAYVARTHHRCHGCGGSGIGNGPNGYCLICKGNGVSHFTFSGFVPPGVETDWLMPDNKPLRDVSIGRYP